MKTNCERMIYRIREVLADNAKRMRTHVDRRVVSDVHADGKVDVLRRRRQEVLGRGIVRDDRDHVGRADTGLEE